MFLLASNSSNLVLCILFFSIKGKPCSYSGPCLWEVLWRGRSEQKGRDKKAMCHLLPGLPPQGNLSAHCWFIWTSESMEGTRMEPGWWQSGAMINLDINIKIFISSWIITMETEIWISKINNQYHRLWPELLWASEGSGPTGPIWLHFHLVGSISFTKSWQHIHFIKLLVQKTLGFMPHTHTHSLNAWASHQAWFLVCMCVSWQNYDPPQPNSYERTRQAGQRETASLYIPASWFVCSLVHV